MLRFLARIAGFLVLAAGFAALVVDGTRSIAGHALILTAFRDVIAAQIPTLKQAIGHNIHPLLWDPVATGLLRLPVWLILAGIGSLLLWMARRRPPTIGYSSRP